MIEYSWATDVECIYKQAEEKDGKAQDINSRIIRDSDGGHPEGLGSQQKRGRSD